MFTDKGNLVMLMYDAKEQIRRAQKEIDYINSDMDKYGYDDVSIIKIQRLEREMEVMEGHIKQLEKQAGFSSRQRKLGNIKNLLVLKSFLHKNMYLNTVCFNPMQHCLQVKFYKWR